jgi:hypothetical protein
MSGQWQKSLASGIPSVSTAAVAPFHRIKWSDLTVKSELAKRMLKTLQTCTPVHDCPDNFPTFDYKTFHHPRGKCGGVIQVKLSNNGMGSDLHTWSEDLCLAMMTNSSLNIMPKWVWEEDSLCHGAPPGSKYTYKDSSFGCYFGNQVDPTCNSATSLRLGNFNRTTDFYGQCQLYSYKDEEQHMNWRASAMEVLFTQMNPKVPYLASRLMYEMFGPQGAPDDLITMHIRHGDKIVENPLVKIDQFIEATWVMIRKHRIQNPTIFILTDNIKAVGLFASAAPENWKITYDPTICSKLYTSNRDENGQAAQRPELRSFHGAPALAQMVTLLIALEAKYFLLTMVRNWSRLIEELRLRLIEAPCKHEICSDVEYVGGYDIGF